MTRQELETWNKEALITEVLRLEMAFEGMAYAMKELVEQRDAARAEVTALGTEHIALKAARANAANGGD